MSTQEAKASPPRSLPGSKIAAGAVWFIGAFMTAQFLLQATNSSQNTPWVWALAFGLQYILTLGESPIWRGKPDLLSVACLAADVVINFGGCMAIMNGFDNTGSVKALTATFLGWVGAWPGPVKGVLALVVAAIIAGLPEALWRR